jgi:hypothetical protein
MKRIVNSSDPANEYRGKYYKLTADINMEGESWTPLGGNSATTAFTGTFDGNGKTISNLTVSGSTYVGMFGYISAATIKNLTLEDCAIESAGSYAAGLVAASATGSTITNCDVSGKINGNMYTAGIVAWLTGSITIKDCSVEGTVKSTLSIRATGGSFTAGIIGRAETSAGAIILVEGCNVSADITSDLASAGGIASYFATNNSVTIKNCDVSLSDTKGITANYYAGGIAGNTSNNTTIEGCTVTGGTVKATSPTQAGWSGGLVGDAPSGSTVTIRDCYVQTDVEAARGTIGGLVGRAQMQTGGNVTVTGCAFSGSVTGADYLGGIVGYGTRFTVTDCYVGGEISGARYLGGILGNSLGVGDVSVKDSYIMANLQGSECVGGILGQWTSSGKFSVSSCRFLGAAITRDSLSAAVTLGALSGNAPYNTASYNQTDTFAWAGLMLGKKTLADTAPTDPLFSPDRNGQGFLGWALRSQDGWPAALTNNSGAWSYSAGSLPVLAKFADKMNSEFPAYLAGIPDSGVVGNKADLRAAITATEALNSADYSLETAMWAEVQKRLTYARQINDLYDALQAEIDAVKAALDAAVAELDRLNAITFVGDGTGESPYEISDLDRLLKMNRLVNATDQTTREKYRALSYKLTNNIDMEGVSWTPLGGTTSATAFTGSFDGGDKTISNLALNGTTYLGFFGYTSGATISNLTLKDFSVTGTNYISALVAYSAASTMITNCSVSGTIAAESNYVGGITSYLSGTISSCTAAVDIFNTNSTGQYVGGIAGYFALGMIENCSVRNHSSSGAIINNGSIAHTGGIAGGINSATNIATIQNCSVKANLVGLDVGGIVGQGTSAGMNPDRVVISGCYFNGMIASSSATATTTLGGIAGTMLNNFKITDCRSDGIITMATVAGGILGRFSGPLAGATVPNVNITNCYTTMRIGNGDVAGGIAGDAGTANGASKLIITNSFALNEQVGGETAANAIHAFGEDNVKLDYALEGVKAWDGMLIRIDGEAQTAPGGSYAVSYANLQLAVTWPTAFKDSDGSWTFEAGKLPILKGLSGTSGMSDDFPAYMINPAQRPDFADGRELLVLVNSADVLVKTAYLQDSWERMTAALDAARTLLHNAQATQSEIDTALETLQAAIDGLELYRETTTLEGEGTAESPYLIGSFDDYEEMNKLLDIASTDIYRKAYYKLTGDIDLQGTSRSPMPYTTDTGYTQAFTGDFDGGGFTISNLTVAHVNSTGMFGTIDGGKVHDLNLENCAITGTSSYTGAIAGKARDTVFENIRVTGTVVGSTYLGGIVGNGSGTLKNCHFEGTVETQPRPSPWAGGISGQFNGNIEDCSFKGKLTYNGPEQVDQTMGGIVGQFTGEDIKGCYVDAEITYKYNTGEATVNAGSRVGGIVGRFDGNNIIDCHF